MKSSIQVIDNFIARFKKWQEPMERFVFPLLLLLWPFAAASQGVTVMDTTYNLGNYIYLGPEDGFWYMATFLANVVGRFFTKLPFGTTMLGMSVLCSLIISAMALCSYFTLKRMIPGWMVFIGEWIAISFAWCPAVIMYNYLTYLFLTLACLCLFRGVSGIPGAAMKELDTSRKTLTWKMQYGVGKWFVLAGFFLGINVFVRVANAAEVLLILAVWFYCLITGSSVSTSLRRTFECILGFVLGFGIILLVTVIAFGPTYFVESMTQLLSATSTTGGYTAGGMLSAILLAYWHSLRWFLILIPCMVMGYFLFGMPFMSNHMWIKRLVYVAGICIVIKFYLSRGMFTLNYQDYPSMFEWGMMLVILTWIMSILGATGKWKGTDDEQFLAVLCMLLLLILPLGSNNYTYPILNCLFVLAPFLVWMLRRYWQETRGGIHFAWHSMAMMILVMAVLQGSLFHMNFAFRDGTDGTRRSSFVEGNAVAAGMHTTPENAEALTALTSYLRGDNQDGRNALWGQELITFGNAPGIHYLMEMPPAIDTTWPDLDSYTTDRFEAALEDVSSQGKTPVVIVREMDEGTSSTKEEKYDLLEAFLREGHYETAYDQQGYTVYRAN